MNEAPTVLSGRWRLEGQLGFGGMGTVHQATELATGRTVAVKMMAPSLAEDAEQVARFERLRDRSRSVSRNAWPT